LLYVIIIFVLAIFFFSNQIIITIDTE